MQGPGSLEELLEPLHPTNARISANRQMVPNHIEVRRLRGIPLKVAPSMPNPRHQEHTELPVPSATTHARKGASGQVAGDLIRTDGF